MPKIGLNNPPMGPALLQAIAKNLGSDVSFLDINLDFQKTFENEHHIINDWCELHGALDLPELLKLQDFTENLDLKGIGSADLVGISVFSTHSFSYTTWFLENFRSQISGKIAIGGAGVNVNDYGKQLYDRGLIDFYVLGEGEIPWKSLLCDDLPCAGVNSPGQALANFDLVPVPDYAGYHLEKYLNSKVHGITIGVEGSRGCVRNCTFCDIRSFWKKYKFKDGVKLAEELINLKIAYNASHFFFNDSLVNGSDKAFRDFIARLSKHNHDHSAQQINWSGYYIIKSATTYKESDWINLKNSGVRSLYIGIESGSEAVRDHMKKKFSNADIDYAMSKIQLYGIRCTWLMIIGYPTETQEDFQETLNLLERYEHMAKDRTIDTVALGLTLGITAGSPLEVLKEDLNIKSAFENHASSGVYWENENSDFRIRLMRRIQAEKLIRKLGYNSWVGDNDTISYFEKKLEDLENGVISEDDVADRHG
jgi:radical SAM superfamily enzyme YgiQ (UPF0313 family)